LRSESIALNYAQALFDLAERGGAGVGRAGKGKLEAYGSWLDAVANGIAAAPQVETVLMSPRVTKAEKSALLAKGLQGAPREFVLFVQAVIKRGRQGLLREMAREYQGLVDQKLNRVRAAVTLARPVDAAFQKRIAERLTKLIGKEVLPFFHEDPAVLGGVVVRVGDRVFDGSVRRRMTMLRRALLTR